MAKPTARIGFVGAGYIAEKHCSLMTQIPSAEVVACCDISRERAELLATRWGGRVFTNFVEMMDVCRLDCVFVCTPPAIRLGVIEAAAVRGIHVFLEKPLSLRLDEGRNIVEISNSKRIILHVGYAYRYHDATRIVKERIERGELGEITLFAGRYWGGIPGPGWWRKKNTGGGQLVEQATHIFDLARYLLGDIDSVCAATDCSVHDKDLSFEVEDSAIVMLKFKSGHIGYISSTCSAPFQEMSFVEAVVVGSRGMSLIRPRVVELISTQRQSQSRGDVFLDNDACKEHITHSKDVGYLRQCEAFIRSVLGDSSGTLVTAEDALQTLAICLAAHHSSASQGWVRVDMGYNEKVV